MTRIERASHVTFICLCVVCMGLLLERRFAGGGDNLVSARAESWVGKKLPAIAEKKASRGNVVLFLSTKCHFCIESLPFYKQLVEAASGDPGKAMTLQVLSVEPAEVMESFLAERGVNIPAVHRAPAAAGLHTTPTVLIADSSGTVRQVFVGRLNQEHQDEVLKLVRGTD